MSPSAIGTIILSAFIAHTAWHWLTDRWSVLIQYGVQWPVFDLALLATLLRWAMLAVLAVLAAWLVRPLVGAAPSRRARSRAGQSFKGSA